MTPSPLMREMRVIENYVLHVMMENQPGDYPSDSFAFSLRFLAQETDLHRDVVRGVCRSLTDQGLAFYMKGLWSEEGMPAGAGYGITDAGLKRISQILQKAA